MAPSSPGAPSQRQPPRRDPHHGEPLDPGPARQRVGIIHTRWAAQRGYEGTGRFLTLFFHAEGNDVLKNLSGSSAIGHNRYATSGSAELRDVQPLFADLSEGGMALAHNGNLTNAMILRQNMVQKGSIFQSTSELGVMIRQTLYFCLVFQTAIWCHISGYQFPVIFIHCCHGFISLRL